MSLFDVAVIGAGPSGCTAATLLARAGRRVALIDPGREGARVGETLPSAAQRLLAELDLPGPPDAPHRPVRGVISAWGGPPVIEDFLGTPDGVAWRLDRPSFDRALENAAIDAGAKRLFIHVRGLHRKDTAWQLDTATGPLRAKRLIDASGRRAVAARMLGVPRVRQVPQVAAWCIGQPLPQDHAGTDRTLIDAGASGWWYGAILPDRRPLAIYHCAPERANRLRRNSALWHEALTRSDVLSWHLPTAAFDGAQLEFCDASGAFTHPVCGEGWLACGDAALAFDPIASQGLFHALRSAQAAAGVLLSPDETTAADSYAHEMTAVWDSYTARHAAVYTQLERDRITA